MSIQRQLTRLALTLVCAVAGAVHAAGLPMSEYEVEVREYIEIFQLDNFELHHEAIGELKWSGIADEAKGVRC